MKKCILVMMMIMLLFSMGCLASAEETWDLSVPPEVSGEMKEWVAHVTEKLLGVNYEAVALLGKKSTGEDGGEVTCFLCRTTLADPKAHPSYSLLYIRTTKDGTPTVQNIWELWVEAHEMPFDQKNPAESSGVEGSEQETVVPATISPETTIIDIGVETPVEIRGYSRYTGTDAGYFLKAGDKVAVISPSALPSREQVEAAMEGLKAWGYVPVEGNYVCTEERTLDNCREDLEWALTDPEIRGIFCVRGGYASCEVLEVMNRELIADARKPMIGYSDISAYHSGWTVAGLPSVHASMAAAFHALPEDCTEAQQRMMQGEVPVYACGGSEYNKQGSAEGILIGGNLTVLLTVLHTEYDCMATEEPYILFLEDVGSGYLDVHCALTVLKNAGVLENAAGLILGEWTEFKQESDDYDGSSRGGRFASVYDMMDRQFLRGLDIPIAYGFPAGHGEKNYPLLMGARVRLNVEQDGYTLEWLDVE